MAAKKPAKGSPAAKAIVSEYEAATREARKYADNDNSPAANAARTRFDQADKRRWSWR
jgi:hypothetical protein